MENTFRHIVSHLLPHPAPSFSLAHLWPAWVVIALLVAQLAWSFALAYVTQGLPWRALLHQRAWHIYLLELVLISALGCFMAWDR